MKIKGKVIGTLNFPRLFLPGITIEAECPSCGECDDHYGEEYFVDSPPLNKPTFLWLYCEECDEQWREMVVLELKVKPYRSKP